MRVVLFANTDWYLYNFRLSTALQLQACGNEVAMLSPPGDFGIRFAGHGLRWLQLPMDRSSLNPLREAWTIRQLVRLLRIERPDLLHNFTVKCAVYGGIAARVARVPAVVNAVAGLGYVYASDQLKARLLRPVVNTLMRGVFCGRRSRVVLQNEDDAAAFAASRLAPPQNIRVIRGSGVNVERFRPRERDAARHPLRVVLAARLLREKGIHEFAEAAILLREQGRSIEFLLAGTPDAGNPHSVEEQQVDRWQRQGVLRWLGHVDDMPALLRGVDVMVLPSYYREGVPKSLLEGSACGLALVTTNLPGCREVVTEDGVDGLHVAPRDPHALAAALARLDDDRTLLQRLGARAREQSLKCFDERLIIAQTFAVYDELMPASARDEAAMG
jgi:glycosyltransferase involved in cell wall biosynthesis